MWFIFVAVGLVVLIAGGIYTRRRIATSLAHFGVRERRIRIVRWVIAWLLFGFPIVMVVAILASLALGLETLPRLDGLVASWLLALPFTWALLVVLQSLPWLIAIDVAQWIVRRWQGSATAARIHAVAVLAVIGVFAVYTPVRVLAERGDVRVRHHQVGRSTLAPFRIAFIADVQQDVHTNAERAAAVYGVVNASRPDIILSGGDWINAGPDHIESAAATAGRLQSRLGTFSVRGDHEHFAYFDRERSVVEVERAMTKHGIAMVSDEVRWFEHGGKRIAVVFLNYNYVYKTDAARISTLVASVAHADYRIVVTHQFNAKLSALLANRVDLVLGAHTHGGQVNPVVGVTHVKLARLETDYVDGRYQVGTTTVIITSGIGYSVLPLRYAAPGSIELIELGL